MRFPTRFPRRAAALIGVLLLAAAPAGAQQPPPQQAQPDPLTALMHDWAALTNAQRHVAESLSRYLADAQLAKQRLDNLDKYLKACGDQAGCTVPVK